MVNPSRILAIRQHRHLSSIVCAQLMHDVAQMDLHRALADAEVERDRFVRFALTQSVDNGDFTTGKNAAVRFRAFRRISGLHQDTRWNESPTCLDEPNCLDSNVEGHVGWKNSANSMIERGKNIFGGLVVQHEDCGCLCPQTTHAISVCMATIGA